MPSLAERWLDMAEGSREAGNAVLQTASPQYRSAASRYYYAAYQAGTALLHHDGSVALPIIKGEGSDDEETTREGWGHKQTPTLIEFNVKRVPLDRDARKDIAGRLGLLYKLRISADYISTDEVLEQHIRSVQKDTDFILKVVANIVRGGRARRGR